ncbi:hypothetical protein [Luteibacter sp. ME-Dv--P-043b]|uniref:hypothetical protein n=1 Tax=unclassified Luteibacter TaxID=2620188 RepID=UPI002555707C|nr:hypothetical protein [Luteibacter sp. ME-Dv--P-043b]
MKTNQLLPGEATMKASVSRAAAVDQSESSARSTQRIDFSYITPRQLQAYLDDMIAQDKIDPDDATSMFNSIPGEWYADQPDVPIDFSSNIKAIAEFDRNNGYPALAAWYEGLAERMRIMEDRSVHISVVA